VFILVGWWVGGLLLLDLIENKKYSLNLNHNRFSFASGCENGSCVQGYEVANVPANALPIYQSRLSTPAKETSALGRAR